MTALQPRNGPQALAQVVANRPRPPPGHRWGAPSKKRRRGAPAAACPEELPPPSRSFSLAVPRWRGRRGKPPPLRPPSPYHLTAPLTSPPAHQSRSRSASPTCCSEQGERRRAAPPRRGVPDTAEGFRKRPKTLLAVPAGGGASAARASDFGRFQTPPRCDLLPSGSRMDVKNDTKSKVKS